MQRRRVAFTAPSPWAHNARTGAATQAQVRAQIDACSTAVRRYLRLRVVGSRRKGLRRWDGLVQHRLPVRCNCSGLASTSFRNRVGTNPATIRRCLT